MSSIIAAIKREPARHLMQNLISQLSGRSSPIDVSGGGTFGFKLNFIMIPRIDKPLGEPFSVDIKDDGEITAFFVAELYAQRVECSVNLNDIIHAGTELASICLVPTPFGCAVKLTLRMPRIPRISVGIDTRLIGLDGVPLAAFDTFFAVRDAAAGDPDGDDKRQLNARLVFLSTAIRPNDAVFARMIVDAIVNFVLDKVKGIPVLGQILRYVGNFLQQIADGILNALAAVSSWIHFVEAEVQQAVTSRIAHAIWEPTVAVKVGQIPSRVTLAEEFVAPTGDRQPPVYLNLYPIEFDVNTDCASGPELRLRATPI